MEINSNNKVIEVQDLTKIYKIGDVQVKALRGVNLSISKGEFVAIMGPSGSGKSTLMNILGCLDIPTKGTYILEDTDAGKLKDNKLAEIRNKKIGFVFQTFNLLSRNNVVDNVELPLIYSTKNALKNRRSRILDSLKAVSLTGWEKHRPSELSGGQKQRVAIARALINDPSIILADEPTGNLDSSNGNEVMQLLTDLNEKGTTIIMVTHSEHDARYSHRIIRMLDGQTVTENILI